MKSYRELTTRYLKSHKKRTILTIIGIILSTALLCSVGVLGETFQNNMLDTLKHESGNFHFVISGVNDEQLNMLQNNMKIEELAIGLMLLWIK
jgi:putative ABC transport system permease protein